MSRYSYTPLHQRPHIVVHDHDVLAGRGVNIALHPGNQRLRTLVTTRADDSFCTSYSATEKRAVAEEIVRHIKQLDPPGRFLKRDGRGQVSRGLSGPWEELTERDAVKKVCQALRDCNRLDRQGYAVGVAMPSDVVQAARHLQDTGLTGKQHAARAAAEVAAAQAAATIPSSKRDWGRVSPSVENAAEWLKKQRTDENTTVTPSTAGSEVANSGLVSYDPASLGGSSPYEAFPSSTKFSTAPSPLYASGPLEGYSQTTGAAYAPGQGTDSYSRPTSLPHFTSVPSTEPYRPAEAYRMDPSPGTYQQDLMHTSYTQNRGPTTAPAPAEQTNPVSPDQANPAYCRGPSQDYPGAPEQTPHAQPMYAPDSSQSQPHNMALPVYASYQVDPAPPQRHGQCYVPASQLAQSPYALATAAGDGGGTYHPQTYRQIMPTVYHHAHSSNGAYAVSPAPSYHGGNAQSYHVAPVTTYQATHAQGFHSVSAPDYEPTPPSEYQLDAASEHQGVPLPGYHAASDPGVPQAHSHPGSDPDYEAASDHVAYHSSTESPPTYQQTVEPDLHGGPPTSPRGNEAYTSTSTCFHAFDDTSASNQHSSSQAFSAAPGTTSTTGYGHGHVSAASAGADLLICAASQTTAPPPCEAQDRANASVITADKWEGETLGL